MRRIERIGEKLFTSPSRQLHSENLSSHPHARRKRDWVVFEGCAKGCWAFLTSSELELA